MLIYKTCIYSNIIKAHKTCYAHSPSITPKISSYGLINKYEQFDLNYSTNHIISQKYFMNTIHMNNKTIGLLFTATTQHRFHLVRIPWPFPASYTPNHELIHKSSPKMPQQPLHYHGLHREGSKNSHISIPRFGTDQTAVQGLKPTESSTRHLN